MVHALREIHRVLAPRGLLIDARPDSRVFAYVERATARGVKRFGVVGTNRTERANDRTSDRAVSVAVEERLFRSRRGGRFWYRIEFDGLSDLREYLREHQRLVHHAKWVVDAATRRRHATEPFVLRRAARFEILEATTR